MPRGQLYLNREKILYQEFSTSKGGIEHTKSIMKFVTRMTNQCLVHVQLLTGMNFHKNLNLVPLSEYQNVSGEILFDNQFIIKIALRFPADILSSNKKWHKF